VIKRTVTSEQRTKPDELNAKARTEESAKVASTLKHLKVEVVFPNLEVCS
jgi:hypothetical protein